MTAPASYDRVLAAVKRLSPAWPSTETDTSVGKELGVIATAIGAIADRLDAALDEVFPDTTEELITRWERICRLASREDVDIATRRTAVLSVLRRTSGPRLEQLSAMLAGPFDLEEDQIVFVETLRQFIDAALTETDTTGYTLSATPTEIQFGKPWPSTVDDFGVALYLERNSFIGGTTTVTLTSPQGTVWTVPFGDALADWFYAKDEFLGELAGGTWTLTATQSIGGDSFDDVRLLVSNEVDSAQIYNFFAMRDYSLAGDPNMVEAERLFHRTALGHLNSHVIWRLECIVDDDYSRCDREPVGD